MACSSKSYAAAYERENPITLAEASRRARERREKTEAAAAVPAPPGSAKKYDNEMQLGAGGVAYDVPTPAHVVLHAKPDDARYATGADPTGRYAPPPSVVALTGEWFLSVVLVKDISESPANAMAINAKARTTRTFHMSDLKGIQHFVKSFAEMNLAPLAQVALSYLQHASVNAKRPWKPQTFFRRMLNVLGAMGSLPIYSDCPYPIRLSQDSVWSETLDRAKYMAMECAPTGQAATAALDIIIALNKETVPAVRMGLLIMWHAAARVGDALKIRKRAIKLVGDSLSIVIEEGKGVKLRKSKYTAHTKITGHWREELVRHLATLKPDDLVVQPTSQCSMSARASALNRALQRANPLFTTRSVRRGSLQAMAKGINTHEPTGMETLMKIAGHKSRYTPERYLDMGMEDGEARMLGMKAADNLQLEMEQAADLGLDYDEAAAPLH
jgi:integrase